MISKLFLLHAKQLCFHLFCFHAMICFCLFFLLYLCVCFYFHATICFLFYCFFFSIFVCVSLLGTHSKLNLLTFVWSHSHKSFTEKKLFLFSLFFFFFYSRFKWRMTSCYIPNDRLKHKQKIQEKLNYNQCLTRYVDHKFVTTKNVRYLKIYALLQIRNLNPKPVPRNAHF